MKQKFAEFLFKRIGNKLEDIPNASSHEEIVAYVEDIEDYLSALKDIVIEAVKL